VVQADQDDPESLKRAFLGANAIFTVTDFASNWTKVTESETLRQKAAAAGKSLGEYAGDLERAQGVNAAVAAADPKVLSTLERFVFSTLAPVTAISGGKYTHAWEFDSKAAVQQYIQEKLPQLAQRMSTVTMGIYQESWKFIPAFAPLKQPDGSFAFLRLKWPGPHQAHPEIVASRDTGAFVEALVLHQPPGTHVLGATQIISREDYAALWGRVQGVNTVVKDVSEEEYARNVPEEIQDTMLDLFKFFPEYGYAGGNPDVKTPAELGIKTASLEDFFKSEDWSQALEGKLGGA
jgi:hypothetical protein